MKGRILVLAAFLVMLNPVLAWDDSRPAPGGGVFVGFRDDFIDQSHVAASSRVNFTGSSVVPARATVNRQGVVLPRGPVGDFDDTKAIPNAVLVDGGVYKMWYYGCCSNISGFGYATSNDGFVWTKRGEVIVPTGEGSTISYGDVLKIGATYWFWYSASDGTYYRIHAATSLDGVTWTKYGVVVDVGPPGSADDHYVWRPTVVFDGATYHMWYGGDSFANLASYSIFAATSPDGLTWTKLGAVIPPGFGGAADSVFAAMPDVRWLNGRYEMLYAGQDGTYERILAAESANGLAWQSQGVWLDILSPTETPRVSHPAILVRPDSSWYVYYASDYPNWAGYLAIRSPAGWIRSIPVAIPAGLDWAWFNQTVSVPSGTSINVTVRDATTLAVVGGIRNLTAGSIDLSSVSSSVHPRVVLEAWLTASRSSVPALDEWEVLWSDFGPPTFAGLAAATDLGTGGAVRLSWSAASDPSRPVSYLAFVAPATGAIDYGAPRVVTASLSIVVEGLTDGRDYIFAVRAQDAQGNMERNAVVRHAVPTHNYDDVPPVFGGVKTVTDLGDRASVRIAWDAATDPDTPESNADPSTPITYGVYLSENASDLGTGTPRATTTNTSVQVTGLSPGRTYFVLVRAEDAAGNADANTRIIAVQLQGPAESAGGIPVWLWPLLIVLLASIVAAVLVARRRRAEGNPPK